MPDIVNSGSITVVDGTSGVNPPAGSYLDIGVEDHPAVSIDVEGAFTATLVIEATAELGPATDWFTPVVLNAAGVASSATLTAAGRRFISAAGIARVRLRCTAFTSPPITATLRAGQGFVSAGGGGGGGGGAVTVADGADTALGTTTDAGIITNIAGTAIGFLRGQIIQWAAFLSRLPAALVGGRLDVNLGSAGAAVSVGINKIPGTVSTVNSSTATLLANAVFTGTSEDVSGFAALIVNVFADQAGTLAPEFSSDGTHWDGIGSHAISASTFAVFEFRPGAQFFRLVYTNGGTNQATFRLQTVYHQDDVQLATVMALAAGMPNPTTELVGAALLVQPSGGTTWSPLPTDAAGHPALTGDTAHGATDAGNPVEVGFGAVAHGANPAAVTAGQRTRGYASRAGIPFVIGGHPNIINTTQNFSAAQTNTVLVANSAGTKIVVVGFLITASNANSVNVAVGIGLAQTVTPPSNTTNRFGSHPGVAPGSGFGRGNGAGIIAMGADGDQVLLTSGAPTSGSIDCSVSYYTVPS